MFVLPVLAWRPDSTISMGEIGHHWFLALRLHSPPPAQPGFNNNNQARRQDTRILLLLRSLKPTRLLFPQLCALRCFSVPKRDC